MTLLAAGDGWALTRGRPAPGDPFPSLEMLHGLRVTAVLLRIVLVIVACCLADDTACHIVTGH